MATQMKTGNLKFCTCEDCGGLPCICGNIDKPLNKALVTRGNIKGGMEVIDSEGKVGKVIACEDLHNVHVIFEGDGLEVKVHGKVINCGGSGLYCFVEGCEENSDDIDPLYYFG